MLQLPQGRCLSLRVSPVDDQPHLLLRLPSYGAPNVCRAQATHDMGIDGVMQVVATCLKRPAALVAKVYGILSYWSEARSRPMQGALLAWAQFAGVRPPMEGEDEASAASAAAAPSETAPLSPAHPSSSSAPSHSYPSSRRSGVPRGSLLEQFLRSPASRVERVPRTPSPSEEAARAEQERLETELQRHKNRMAVSMWSESHARLMLNKMTSQHDELLEQTRQLKAELAIATSSQESAKAEMKAEMERAQKVAEEAVAKANALAEAAAGIDHKELETLRKDAAELPKVKAKRDSMQSMVKMYQKKAEANVAELDELRYHCPCQAPRRGLAMHAHARRLNARCMQALGFCSQAPGYALCQL